MTQENQIFEWLSTFRKSRAKCVALMNAYAHSITCLDLAFDGSFHLRD